MVAEGLVLLEGQAHAVILGHCWIVLMTGEATCAQSSEMKRMGGILLLLQSANLSCFYSIRRIATAILPRVKAAQGILLPSS
jgi:hypothetical protein